MNKLNLNLKTMESSINNFSNGLFIWQVIIFMLLIGIIFLVFKYGKLFYKYLKKNIR